MTLEQGREHARRLLVRHAQPTIQEIAELVVEVDRRARSAELQDVPVTRPYAEIQGHIERRLKELEEK